MAPFAELPTYSSHPSLRAYLRAVLVAAKDLENIGRYREINGIELYRYVHTGDAVGVGDVVAYGGAADDRWSAGVVRSMSKRDGRKLVKYRDPVSVGEPNVTLLVSPLVKGAGQGRFASQIGGGQVKMVLADCTEDNVELQEVQRVMGGGRSTEPDIGGGTANAKEWIFSKGETRWFMRHPKLEYDDSIARWR